jgi:serine/threonine protein kinase
VIGSGGSSVVYRAFQQQFDRVVTIKVGAIDVTGGDLRSRFERECVATGRLTGHPNIVTVLAAGVTRAGRPIW